ncbi:hypothetical protein BGX21_005293 [Mortierella sp. AD011]|nr:hypothetical protein BGX20_000148 [Mortierella sp. AD010]KAF9399947.1 hypothetical protein BGX21_005293 [Mortierella sp. AD011]
MPPSKRPPLSKAREAKRLKTSGTQQEVEQVKDNEDDSKVESEDAKDTDETREGSFNALIASIEDRLKLNDIGLDEQNKLQVTLQYYRLRNGGHKRLESGDILCIIYGWKPSWAHRVVKWTEQWEQEKSQ